MKVFAILFSLVSLASTRSLPQLSPTNESSENSTTTDALTVPVNPQVALNNINVELHDQPAFSRIEPGLLYYNIHTYLVELWNAPIIAAITSDQEHRTYSGLATLIQPAPRSTLLTTAVAASTLQKLLNHFVYLRNIDSRHVSATLTTRTQPPRPIGVIKTEQLPGNLPVKIPSLASTDNSTNTVSVSVLNGIAVQVRFDGQSPDYPIISQRVWLQSLTGMMEKIFLRDASEQVIVGPQPQQSIFDFQRVRTPSYILRSQVSATKVPAGKQPLDLKQLMVALTEVLNQVVVRAQFEQVSAVIVKDGWIAARYGLLYQSLGGDTATA
ncbi:MAG: hypothetical protein Q9168_006215 [Polycauliona sp. 1 TL-2023]